MNQLMKNLRLPVAGLVASTGLNAGGVDAAKVEETFGNKSQSGVQTNLVTGDETRGLGENLAGKTEGVQVAQINIQSEQPRVVSIYKNPFKGTYGTSTASNANLDLVIGFKDNCDVDRGQVNMLSVTFDENGFVKLNPMNRQGLFRNIHQTQIRDAINQGLSQ